MKRFIVRCLWLLLAIHFTPLATAAETLSGIGIGAGNNWWRSWVDLNGDGRADFCYRYDPDGERIRCFYSKDGQYTNTPDIDVAIGRNHQPYQWWYDVDGDGLADLCRGYDYKTPSLRIECRFAKDKFQQFTDVAIPFAGYCSDTDCVNMSIDGIVRSSDVFFSDVNGDQRTDICFVYSTNAGNAPFDLRCRLSSGASFGPMTSPWTSIPINPGSNEFPRSFSDMNGDGFPDFCRTLQNGTLSCLLGAENGFTATDLVSPTVDLGTKEGATFTDFNADGKTDYCRITGTSGKFQLRCTPSTGVGWDMANERFSPVIPNDKVGHATARWWIDINADGLPDFCRAVGANPDPSAGPNAEVVDVAGTLSCRLNKGDGSSSDPTGAFYYSDIELAVNFGRGDGGRQWCDPTGSGFPVLCRNSLILRNDGPPIESCDENSVCTISTQYNQYALVTGLGAAGTTQAHHPLLTAYTDGLGAETRIGYLPLTSTEVYTRSGITNTERRFVGPPPTSPVVYETRAWMVGSTGAGSDLTGNARYFYRDLTNDPWAGTSRGFSERWMFSEGTNTIDHTQFFQGLGNGSGSVANDMREVGMVRSQMRYVINSGVVPTPADNGSGSNQPPRKKNEQAILAKVVDVLGSAGGTASKETIASKTSAGSPFILLQRTDNTLRDTAPANPRYRYVGESSVQGYDYNGSSRVALPTASTITTQDNYGNVTRIEQTKTQSAASGTLTWTTITINDYPDGSTAEGLKWLRLGRLKRSTVTSSAPSLDAQIAANARSAGTSVNASAVSSSLGAVGQEAPKPLPLPPQLLMPILQLLLED